MIFIGHSFLRVHLGAFWPRYSIQCLGEQATKHAGRLVWGTPATLPPGRLEFNWNFPFGFLPGIIGREKEVAGVGVSTN